jgi:threonine dehydratase
VAFAAQRTGVRAVIVMPETAPEAKVNGVKRWGGEVVFAGTTSEDRHSRAQALAAADGLAVIPPYDHPHIIAGQGTVGLEIVDDLPEVTDVAVPVGGGGLAAGVTTALAALRPDARMFGVEPEGAAALAAAVAARAPVRLQSTESIADGLLPLSVGTVTFRHLDRQIAPVAVSEQAIAEATVWLYSVQGVLAEPSGAATTAALRSRALRPAGPTVLVVSGGNIDPAAVQALARRWPIDGR